MSDLLYRLRFAMIALGLVGGFWGLVMFRESLSPGGNGVPLLLGSAALLWGSWKLIRAGLRQDRRGWPRPPDQSP